MSKVLKVGTTAVACDETPFGEGFNALAVNFGTADITLTGCDTSDGTFTSLATATKAAITEIDALPKYIKASAASVYIIG